MIDYQILCKPNEFKGLTDKVLIELNSKSTILLNLFRKKCELFGLQMSINLLKLNAYMGKFQIL
jgi:hypothetical protein